MKKKKSHQAKVQKPQPQKERNWLPAAAAAVVVIAEAGSLNGCNNEIVLPTFGEQIKLTEGENRITFTPEETGEFPYSCWMGMLRNTIVVTE